jgi:lysophospholipase L1-like esterase
MKRGFRERNRQLGTLLAALLSATFTSAPVAARDADSTDVYDAPVVSTGDPHVSIAVPEGSYLVSLRLTGPKGSTGSILSEQRRLMVEGIRFKGSKPVERQFVVNVRKPGLGALPDNATGGVSVRLKPRETGAANWDDQLSVEITDGGRILALHAEPTNVPTLYLAGDSTVTDQPVAPNASWGQKLPRFFDGTIAVANHAESGETLKSFVTEQRLDKLLSELQPGDWVMIQFAHNDQKVQWPQTYVEAASTYRSWLRTYIAEIRRRGATPILVTSPDRRNFDAQGKITSTLGDYPQAMRDVAREEKAALIDLNPMSRSLYEALGPELAPRAFADEGRDKTHFNDYGAYQLARCVVEGVRGADPALVGGLASHLAADAGHFDPAHPEPPPR